MHENVDPIAVIFGVIQTAFYVDFAWVYWTRQRVKLRNGGVIDSEDLSRGWLVSRVIGKNHDSTDEEDGNLGDGVRGDSTKPRGWGARSVSVSADHTIADPRQNRKKKSEFEESVPNDGELVPMLEEDAEGEDRDGTLTPESRAERVNNEVSDGSVWRDGSK